MNKIDVVKKLLAGDKLRNLSIMGFMENYPVEFAEYHGSSVIVKGNSDHKWIYISSSDENELSHLLSFLDEDDKYFAVLEDWMIPILTRSRKAEWIFPTVRYFLPETVIISEAVSKIITLEEQHIEEILANSSYSKYLSYGYVKERIRRGVSAGIFDNDELAAWGLTHDDNALGMLHVKEKFRRKGYGGDIVSFLCSHYRINSRIPFCNIEEENVRASSLVQKFGFIPDRRVSWVKLH